MANIFIPHVPGFIDTEKPKNISYNDPLEIMETEWVLKRKNREDFVAFSLYKNKTLMVHYNDNSYWVVGQFEGDTPDLPDWKEFA